MISNVFTFLGLSFIVCVILIGLIFLISLIKYKLTPRSNNEQIKNCPENIIKLQSNLTAKPVIVEKIQVSYEFSDYVITKFNELQKNIEGYKNNHNNFPLLVIGSLIGLDATEIIGKESKFETKFIESSKKMLQYERFKIITNSRITSEIYKLTDSSSIETYHHILCSIYIEKFNNFLTSFQEYFDFIEKNESLLISMKKNYLHQDEFGDVDGKNWIDYLQRFSVKRNLFIESIYPSEIESVDSYISLLKLNAFEGKSISYLLALWEHFGKREDRFAFVHTGVDFEIHLKSILEEQLEGVYVVTTPASGDHGADLLVRYKGIAVAIQAKYYTGSVGNSAVQEIHSGMGYYDADYGMVVTQSKYTEHAKSLATKLNIYLEDIDTFIEKIVYLSKNR